MKIRVYPRKGFSADHVQEILKKAAPEAVSVLSIGPCHYEFHVTETVIRVQDTNEYENYLNNLLNFWTDGKIYCNIIRD